jgi:hypothetical protein
MKHVLLIMMIVFAVSAAHAADVGVSVSVGQPGFYGRIDIGNAPQPELIYERPVVIRPAPGHVAEEPLYLRVPPGHAKKWKKHCSKYNACGRPVYFVRDKWYKDVYVPHYRERGEREQGERHNQGKHNNGNQGHGKGNHGN